MLSYENKNFDLKFVAMQRIYSECSICIAIIAMEYLITDNVH